MTKFKKGHIPWIKGKHHSGETKQKIGNANRGRKLPPITEETRKKLGSGWRGKKRPPFSEEWKRKIGDASRGRKISEETRKKLSINNSRYWLGKHCASGNNHPNWKGGITPVNLKIRNSVKFKIWRRAVFERDNYTCQKTGQIGGKLQAHHKNNFCQFPKLRFLIDNGITLSEKSHKEFHIKYGKKNNTIKQLNEFLYG